MSDALADLRRRLARRHHLIGWWGLLVFLSLGIGLETLHGFKAGFYLDPPHRLRLASFFLTDALLLLPAGFFLGGVGHTEVDPSPGVLLVPVGALLLLLAV